MENKNVKVVKKRIRGLFIHHNYQSNPRNKKNIQIFHKLRKHTKYMYINNIPQNEVYESGNYEFVEYL